MQETKYFTEIKEQEKTLLYTYVIVNIDNSVTLIYL
jgi:hypothetical protein